MGLLLLYYLLLVSTDLFESAAEALEHRLDVAALLHRDDSHLIFLVDPDQERLLQVVPECNAHTSSACKLAASLQTFADEVDRSLNFNQTALPFCS